jgi:predicted MFS family arabinose efflux permease
MDRWTGGAVLALGAVAVALVVAFLVRQARVANPLMPLRLFRSATVSGANLIQALLVAAMFGMFFLSALYLQQILGYDALSVGVAFLPTTIAMGAMSLRFAGPIGQRLGLRATLVASLALIGVGLLLLARTPVAGHYLTDVLPAMVSMGLGAGLSFPALMTIAMSGATPSDSGLASGLVNTSAQVGGALGLAVLATLAASRTDGLLAAGESQAAAVNSGYHLAYLAGAGLVAIAVAVVLWITRGDRPAKPAEPAPACAQAG